MELKTPDNNYWNNKLAAYFHDVEDLNQGSDSVFPNIKLDKKLLDQAHALAGKIAKMNFSSSFQSKLNFSNEITITHPISDQEKLKFKLDSSTFNNKNSYNQHLSKQITDNLNELVKNISQDAAVSQQFLPQIKFFLSHLYLRFMLARKDKKLGHLWHRLPSDNNLPDHSIWQHNALVSSFYSLFTQQNQDPEQVGLMVFSLSPVQPFIGKARKLRDFWTGSVLLSWLAFEGIVWIMENLGPDHLIYPSLIDQPLVNSYLKNLINDSNKDGLIYTLNSSHDIASFPNKFTALVPIEQAEYIAEQVKKHIKQSWLDTALEVQNYLTEKLGFKDDSSLSELFQRQNSNYWETSWSCARLLSLNDKTELYKLWPDYQNKNIDLVENLEQLNNNAQTQGLLYSTTHSLAQSALAASKSCRQVQRSPEPGEKCKLCGEFEVLHSKPQENPESPHYPASYRKAVDKFWKRFDDKKNSAADIKDSFAADIKKNERLCSICLTKRFAQRVLKKKQGHLLKNCFGSNETYPSTAHMAFAEYFHRKGIADNPVEQDRIINKYFEDLKSDFIPDSLFRNSDKYYSILMMDGDKMGDLINGKTIGANWKSVFHPQFWEQLPQDYKDLFKDQKRMLTPSLHASIAEALADFSLYGVSPLVQQAGGRLIYSGGDDVCAVVPTSKVLQVAKQIEQYYRSTFRLVKNQANSIDSVKVEESCQPLAGQNKLSLNLGSSKGISISAGILLCHFKESLVKMIARAHTLLDSKAKQQLGRNGFALELTKRSGGSRVILSKWDNTKRLESIKYLQKQISVNLSKSLVYRFKNFKVGVNEILKREEDWQPLFLSFIEQQLKRSDLIKELPGEQKDKTTKRIAQEIINLCVDKVDDNEIKRTFTPERIVVVAYMGV